MGADYFGHLLITSYLIQVNQILRKPSDVPGEAVRPILPPGPSDETLSVDNSVEIPILWPRDQ